VFDLLPDLGVDGLDLRVDTLEVRVTHHLVEVLLGLAELLLQVHVSLGGLSGSLADEFDLHFCLVEVQANLKHGKVSSINLAVLNAPNQLVGRGNNAFLGRLKSLKNADGIHEGTYLASLESSLTGEHVLEVGFTYFLGDLFALFLLSLDPSQQVLGHSRLLSLVVESDSHDLADLFQEVFEVFGHLLLSEAVDEVMHLVAQAEHATDSFGLVRGTRSRKHVGCCLGSLPITSGNC